MGLLEIPNEITIVILKHLPKRRLKRMRMVSKKLSLLAAPILLDVLYISPRSKDIEVFEAIVQHPVLRIGIKDVVYDSAQIIGYTLEDYCNALQEQLRASAYKRIEISNDAVRELMQILRPHAESYTTRNQGFRQFKNNPVWMQSYRQHLAVAKSQATNVDGAWFTGTCEGLRKLGPIRSVTIRNSWDMVHEDDTWCDFDEGSVDAGDDAHPDTDLDEQQDMDNMEDQWEDCSSNDASSDFMTSESPGLRCDGTRLVGSPLARACPPTWLSPPSTSKQLSDRESICGVDWEAWNSVDQEFALLTQILKSAKLQPYAFRVLGNLDGSERLSANALGCLDVNEFPDSPFLCLASNLKEFHLSLSVFEGSAALRPVPDLSLLKSFIERAKSLVSLKLLMPSKCVGSALEETFEDQLSFDFTNVFPTLIQMDLSNLNTLGLVGLRISYRDLIGLLFLKLPNLQNLHLLKVKLVNGGDWENIVEGLRHRHMRTCDLIVSYSGSRQLLLKANSDYIVHGGRHPALKGDEADSASLKYLESLKQELDGIQKEALGVQI
ncbi:MAG: hypothetical protein Q9168_005126 [Polycauliona sp. 1 TL-2023]